MRNSSPLSEITKTVDFITSTGADFVPFEDDMRFFALFASPMPLLPEYLVVRVVVLAGLI